MRRGKKIRIRWSRTRSITQDVTIFYQQTTIKSLHQLSYLENYPSINFLSLFLFFFLEFCSFFLEFWSFSFRFVPNFWKVSFLKNPLPPPGWNPVATPGTMDWRAVWLPRRAGSVHRPKLGFQTIHFHRENLLVSFDYQIYKSLYYNFALYQSIFLIVKSLKP